MVGSASIPRECGRCGEALVIAPGHGHVGMQACVQGRKTGMHEMPGISRTQAGRQGTCVMGLPSASAPTGLSTSSISSSSRVAWAAGRQEWEVGWGSSDRGRGQHSRLAWAAGRG